MRHLTAVLGLSAILLLSGCADSKWSIFRHQQDSAQLMTQQQPPTADQLVAHLNRNAAQIHALVCSNVDLDCKQGLQQWHIPSKLACQKPRNFRLMATVVGHSEADIGSNDYEFWYWIKRGDPYLIHCSYQDLEKGVRIPFPFQPEWVMEALGMAQYDPRESYEVLQKDRTYQLVQNTRNAQGQRVRKVIVFNMQNGQVTDHILTDLNGRREICRAHIDEHIEVRQGVVLPRRIVFTYPAESLSLKMTLWHRADEVTVDPQFDAERINALFRRPVLQGVPSYDLARGPDSTNAVQRAGGY
jgi:hypothetical protein